MTDDEQPLAEEAVRPESVVRAGNPALPPAPDPAEKDEDESTVGTGSAIALGCIAATLLLIVFGLILLAVFALAR